jgi:hypothetical protein
MKFPTALRAEKIIPFKNGSAGGAVFRRCRRRQRWRVRCSWCGPLIISGIFPDFRRTGTPDPVYDQPDRQDKHVDQDCSEKNQVSDFFITFDN